jgi:hypothetical protein
MVVKTLYHTNLVSIPGHTISALEVTSAVLGTKFYFIMIFDNMEKSTSSLLFEELFFIPINAIWAET